MSQPDLQQIEQAAVRLLATREHSQTELRRKLHARGHDAEAVEAVLEGLAARRLQSDARFAEQYVASRRQRGYGPVRIRAELQERGVAETLIGEGLEQGDAGWLECLCRAHDKKFGSGPPGDFKEQARRAHFLQYRGFTAEQIRSLFRADDCSW